MLKPKNSEPPNKHRHPKKTVTPRNTLPPGSVENLKKQNGASSQTLARGLELLEIVATTAHPLTIQELAGELGVHRSNAYRLLRALEERRFVFRDDAGRVHIGAKMATLAMSVSPALRTAAEPVLAELSHSLAMTSFITILDAGDAVTLTSRQPRGFTATIARTPGGRHPVRVGAPGIAIEASLTPAELRRLLAKKEYGENAKTARLHGYAVSCGEIIAGVTSVAVPLRINGEPPAALAIMHFSNPANIKDLAKTLQEAAVQITRNHS